MPFGPWGRWGVRGAWWERKRDPGGGTDSSWGAERGCLGWLLRASSGVRFRAGHLGPELPGLKNLECRAVPGAEEGLAAAGLCLM